MPCKAMHGANANGCKWFNGNHGKSSYSFHRPQEAALKRSKKCVFIWTLQRCVPSSLHRRSFQTRWSARSRDVDRGPRNPISLTYSTMTQHQFNIVHSPKMSKMFQWFSTNILRYPVNSYDFVSSVHLEGQIVAWVCCNVTEAQRIQRIVRTDLSKQNVLYMNIH